MTDELRFDIMVKTEEAKNYMASHYNNFHSIGYLDSGKSVLHDCNYEIFIADYERYVVTYTEEQDRNNLNKDYFDSLSEKLRNLVQALEENKKLLVQIDLLSNSSKKELSESSISHGLELSVQNIMYISSLRKRKYYGSNVIVMHKDSPLLTLGFIAQMLCANPSVVIESTVETAVLCYLFVTLCHEAGLKNITLAFVEQALPGAIDVAEVEELHSGCMGVVSERADIDSAVDAFLSSGTHHQFKIRRILVQESVSDRLRNVLAWKAKLNPPTKNLVEVTINCSEIYKINNKVFVYEYCGHEQNDYITIEAYRTVKELLSLSKTYKPFSVSLWCSDVSQSNEIVYGIDSTVVWINDYCSFHGPVKASQALYSVIDVAFSKWRIDPDFDVKRIETARDKWMKLDASKKHKILTESLKRANVSLSAHRSNSALIDSIEDESFVEVGDGRICVGLEIPASVVMFHDTSYRLNEVVETVTKGSAVLIPMRDLRQSETYNLMKSDGVPLDFVKAEVEGAYSVASQYSPFKIKVVWSNFGTIFAN